jgi:hypothetical protein
VKSTLWIRYVPAVRMAIWRPFCPPPVRKRWASWKSWHSTRAPEDAVRSDGRAVGGHDEADLAGLDDGDRHLAHRRGIRARRWWERG